jgi:hypothetical protein
MEDSVRYYNIDETQSFRSGYKFIRFYYTSVSPFKVEGPAFESLHYPAIDRDGYIVLPKNWLPI